MPRRKIRVESRFYRAIDFGPDCWMWIRAISATGYGVMSIRGRTTPAHRVSWELHRGPLAPRQRVLHSCGNRSCVRPEHLQVNPGGG